MRRSSLLSATVHVSRGPHRTHTLQRARRTGQAIDFGAMLEFTPTFSFARRTKSKKLRRGLRRLAGACAVALLSCAHAQPQPAPVEQPSPSTLQKACDESHFDACQKLGELHREGRDVPKDLPAAEKLLRKACDGHELSA